MSAIEECIVAAGHHWRGVDQVAVQKARAEVAKLRADLERSQGLAKALEAECVQSMGKETNALEGLRTLLESNCRLRGELGAAEQHLKIRGEETERLGAELTQLREELAEAKDRWGRQERDHAQLASRMREDKAQLRALIAELEGDKNSAYAERNKLVAVLTRLYPSGKRATDIPGWDPEWHGCVYVDSPAGQLSWHYHDSGSHLFADLPAYTRPWDGHTTEDKYGRLESVPDGFDPPSMVIAVLEDNLIALTAQVEALTAERDGLASVFESVRAVTFRAEEGESELHRDAQCLLDAIVKILHRGGPIGGGPER